jgi:hypothetical protein
MGSSHEWEQDKKLAINVATGAAVNTYGVSDTLAN